MAPFRILILMLSGLIGFNMTNSRLDAWLIFKNKTVAHWVNFTSYFIWTGIEMWWAWHYHGFAWSWWYILLFLFTAFLYRRVVFGISLNIRRGLKDITIKWYYISRAERPAAWLDRQEIKYLGRNGKKIHTVYICLLVVFTALLFIFCPK